MVSLHLLVSTAHLSNLIYQQAEHNNAPLIKLERVKEMKDQVPHKAGKLPTACLEGGRTSWLKPLLFNSHILRV